MRIREDDLTDPRILAFLGDHLDEMVAITPEGSVHALDVHALRAPDITFWSAWEGEELVGCGALKELDAATGEVKSMRTAPARRRAGVATRVLEHILDEARRRGYSRLHLETGSTAVFARARAFYERHGFRYRGRFGDYPDDPHSVFMTRDLEAPR